jgi:hypothetical protein
MDRFFTAKDYADLGGKSRLFGGTEDWVPRVINVHERKRGGNLSTPLS